MIRLHRTGRIVSLVVASLFAVAFIAPVQTFAESSQACGPIISGLWSGVNFMPGTQYDCQGNPIGVTSMAQGSATPGVMTGEYVALGDSVAAGLGLPLASDSLNNPACGVSSQAYSADVAASMNMPFQNVACSGATVGDLVTEQGLSGSSAEVTPQLNTAFANGTPSLITITAGANDVHWSSFLRECYIGSCGNSTDQVIASSLRTVLSAKLAFALSDINSRSGGSPPPVIVTGYYQPLSEACAQTQSNVTDAEISWIRSQTDALNQTIASVASSYSFVHFAPVDFTGHELCTSDPWVQGPTASAPFHPTAQGQQAIADAVLAQI